MLLAIARALFGSKYTPSKGERIEWVKTPVAIEPDNESTYVRYI